MSLRGEHSSNIECSPWQSRVEIASPAFAGQAYFAMTKSGNLIIVKYLL